MLERILGDISKKSASKQIVIGATSGWVTGYVTFKVGKLAAFAVGSTIILLQVANEHGLIKIDWSKVNKRVDQVTDRVEEAVTGESPRWMDKAERFIDRKLDRAEDLIRRKQNKAKKWYSSLIGDENGVKLNELHIFMGAFAGGLAIGFACS